MAKKLWVGLGVGCGVIILLVAIGVGVSAYFLKKNFGGFAESAKKSQAQHAELVKLDQQFPFDASGNLTLTEARLDDYLAVRGSALEAYQGLQAQLDALKAKDKKNDASVSQVMAEAQQAMSSAVEVEQRYIDGLKAHKMSPSEFQAISRVAMSQEASGPNGAILTQHKAQLEQVKNPGLDGFLMAENPSKAVQNQLTH